MRFVVFGAGAIGGLLGARLHEAGHEVALVACGPRLSTIRERGLTLATPAGRTVHEIPAAADPREPGPRSGDTVLLATRRQDTAGTGRLETDYLNGEIVLVGRLHGIPTPVNAALCELATRPVRERRRPGQGSPAEVLAGAA